MSELKNLTPVSDAAKEANRRVAEDPSLSEDPTVAAFAEIGSYIEGFSARKEATPDPFLHELIEPAFAITDRLRELESLVPALKETLSDE